MGLFGLGKKPGLGIDIAVDAVKVIELMPEGDEYVLSRVVESPLPKNLVTDDEITDIDKLANAIKQARKKSGTKVTEVTAAVSGNQAISKQVAMAFDLDENGIAEKIETDAEALIPFPISEVRYDFESLGEHPTLAGQQRVLVTATRTISVDTRVQALEDGGFKVRIMDVDNQAILRACDYLIPHLHSDILESKKPTLILDISHQATQMVVIHHGEVSFTRYQSGGIAPLLSGLDNNGEIDQVEILAKLRANELDDFSDLVTNDFLSNLGSQVSRGIQIYRSNASEKEFGSVLVINTGAMIPMIVKHLDGQLNPEVRVLNPFEHFSLPDKSAHLQPHGPRFVQAIGLALRSFTQWHM